MKKKEESHLINIYLVRHGEAAQSWATASDSPLSGLGKKQADLVATGFSGSVLSLVTSPMLRARQTAIPLSHKWDTDVHIEDCFREIPSDAEEKNRRLWLNQIFQKKWDMVDSKLQSWREDAFKGILQKDMDTVIFTHFMLINAVVSRITERDELVVFQPDNASITHLQITDRKTASVIKLGKEKETIIN